jgi:phosphoribosylformylglycinamidine synthase
MLEGEGRIVARYVGENPNGSRNLIAGITNAIAEMLLDLCRTQNMQSNDLTGPSAQMAWLLYFNLEMRW